MVIVDYYGLIDTIVALTNSRKNRYTMISNCAKKKREFVFTADFAKFRRNGNAINAYSD